MIIDSDGSEYDWILGYDPPPENFQSQLEKALRNEDTFKSISAAYAKDPKNVETVFKLARKYDDRYDREKSTEIYKEVIALDPEGKTGSYTTEYTKITVPYTQYAEFAIATADLYGEKPDLGPARAFVKKYADSKLAKEAYSRMSRYYIFQASKEEAAGFFPEYAAKYPNDAHVLDSWLRRVVKDKGPLDKGAELVARIEELTQEYRVPGINQDIADFYFLKDDTKEAEKAYGKDFMETKVSRFAYDLVSYANFWLAKNANQESAVDMVETALKLRPDNAYMLQQAAAAYVKTEQDEKALDIFGPEYIKPKNEDANSLYSYARFWAMQGKNLDSAMKAAKRSVELKPHVYYTWSTLSDVQLKLGDLPEALKAAEKAFELAEEYAKQGMKAKVDKIKKELGREE